MIIGIGTDIVGIERIERVIARRGDAFRLRVYTPGELAFCSRHRRPGPSLAGRWAAKEACMKALGTGWSGPVRFVDIEVQNDAAGRPGLTLHGETAALATRLGAVRWHLSLSHADGVAVATVVLEG
jgi:holo-[acyl-carrier protein] synthase